MVVLDDKDVEFDLTVAAIPVTVIVLFMAGFWTRRESILGMIFTIILYFGGSAYFLFKLVRMYDNSTPAGAIRVARYLPARRGLTTFAIMTLLLLVATIINAVWCTLNFDKGLKPHLQKRRLPDDDSKAYSHYESSTLKDGTPLGTVSQRMTID